MTKEDLLSRGLLLVRTFCEENRVEQPALRLQHRYFEQPRPSCGFYRNRVIYLSLRHCAAPGLAGRNWSWPGYAVDRTPFGVACHEAGHHLDEISAKERAMEYPNRQRAEAYLATLPSRDLRASVSEPGLTTYADTNSSEYFAEAFRLFLTNPELLCLLRPATYARLRERWRPVVEAPWEQRLLELGAPERTINAAKNRISSLRRPQAKLR